MHLRTTSLPGIPRLRLGVQSLNFLRVVWSGFCFCFSAVRKGIWSAFGRDSSSFWVKPLRVVCVNVFLSFRSKDLFWVNGDATPIPWHWRPDSSLPRIDILLLQAMQSRILEVAALYLRTTSLPGLPSLRIGVLSLNFLWAVRRGFCFLLSLHTHPTEVSVNPLSSSWDPCHDPQTPSRRSLDDI